MSRTAAISVAVLCLLVGGGLLVYVIFFVPPLGDNGQVSVTAVIVLLLGLLGFAAGLGSLLALFLHSRWPVLAGRRTPLRPRQKPSAAPALRQGLLLGLVAVVLVLLALLHSLDITFAVVTVLLAVLVEAFVQTRM